MPRPINGVPQGTVDICFAHKDFMLDTAGHWTVAWPREDGGARFGTTST